MNVRALYCRLFGHAWQRWQRDKVASVYRRTCARCGLSLIDAKRTPYARKRAVNAADTVTGINKERA